MATNLTIEAPDFYKIRKEAGQGTADAVNLLWLAFNEEAKSRRMGVREAVERWAKAVTSSSPSAQQNNYNPKSAAILRFDGSDAFTLTGIRNGREGALHLIVVLGSGTVTLAHNSASSDERNRLLMQSAGNLAVTTNRAVLLAYLNARWREMNWM